MRKIVAFSTIFIIVFMFLIFISLSQCYATSTELILRYNNNEYDLYPILQNYDANIDITNFNYVLVRDNLNGYVDIMLADNPFLVVNNWLSCPYTHTFYLNFNNGSPYVVDYFYEDNGSGSGIGYINDTDSINYFNANIEDYSDNEVDVSQLVNCYLDTQLLYNSVSGIGEIGGGESGGGEEEEDNILSNLGTLLYNLIVPSSENFDDIQDDFTDKILSHFNIPILRRDSSYDNSQIYLWIGENKPVINLYGYNIDLELYGEFLDTPFDFGLIKQDFGSQNWVVSTQTGGLTIRGLFNILFGIECILMNICLYNKFFEKE